MKDQSLDITFPANGNEPKIIVEAAHIYTNEQPSLEHQIGAQIGGQISKLLGLLHFNPQKWLFIDNYNPQFEEKPEVLDKDSYIAQLSTWGFTPDNVYYEADLAGRAQEVLDYLVANHYASQHPLTGKFLLGKGNILLYDPESEKFACSLLDACLYLEKGKQSDCSVTILDKQFKSQQKGTLTILNKLGFDKTTVVPVYYSTPEVNIHTSSSPQNVYGNGTTPTNGEPQVAVADVITMLKIMGKLSEAIPMETSLDLEVMKYVA